MKISFHFYQLKEIPIDPTSIANFEPAAVEDVLSGLLMQVVHKETAKDLPFLSQHQKV